MKIWRLEFCLLSFKGQPALVLKVHLSTLSQENDTEKDVRKITQSQRPLMFCEPKGQELNTFICNIFWEFFDPPGNPLGVHLYIFGKNVV